MAGRVFALDRIAGQFAAGALVALVLGTLGAVAFHAGGLSALGSWDWRAVWFTVWQALLSATISAALAVPVARALARRRFAGQRLLVTLLGAPFILPVIVAVTGLVAVFGRHGWVNLALGQIGVGPVSIFGWQGVVLAHVFFNLPLATRLILQGWQAIPAERIRLAQSLGFGPGDTQRHLEHPMLRELLPGVWLAIFLVCLTSFAVALALGGGPRATTVELAIYQAFRFDFDMGRAATLALVQVGLCLIALTLAGRIRMASGFGAGLDRQQALDRPGGWLRWQDGLAIALASGFLILPMASVLAEGLPRLPALSDTVWQAAGRSVLMALLSSALTLAVALSIAQAAAGGLRWVEAAGTLPIVASPLVLGTGLYLILRSIAAPEQLALPVTVAINAVMALPFALRVLVPAARAAQADYGRLAQSLNLTGWARMRLVTLPRLGAPLGFAGGLAAALAMGDLGVITLFADTGVATLPFMLYQLMSSYRSADAMAAAVLLMAISFALFVIFDRLGRRHA